MRQISVSDESVCLIGRLIALFLLCSCILPRELIILMRFDAVRCMQPVLPTTGPYTSACHNALATFTCCHAGLTALQSLYLVGCCSKVVMPGAEWIHVLRRTSELEFCDGTLAVYALEFLLSNGTVGELAVPHVLRCESHGMLVIL